MSAAHRDLKPRAVAVLVGWLQSEGLDATQGAKEALYAVIDAERQ